MALIPQQVKLRADDPLTLSKLSIASSYVPGGGLQWNCFNSAAGVTLHLTGKYYDNARGNIVNLDTTLVPTSNRLLSSQYIPLGDGYLLSLRINVSAGTVVRGQCWNIVGVAGTPGATLIDQILVSDYVTTQTECTYPGGIIRQSTEGRGRIFTQAINAGAGNEVNVTVPANSLWHLKNISGTFSTDAIAGNRHFIFTASVNGFSSPQVTSDLSALLIANSSLLFSVAPYGATSTAAFALGTSTLQNINMPETFLVSGGAIQSITENMGPTDTYIGYATIEEWINV